VRTVCVQVAASVVAVIMIAGAAAALPTPQRFFGSITYAESQGTNPTGRGNFHSFLGGSVLDATFLDEGAANTRYRFCFERKRGGAARCWKGRTKELETRSTIHAVAPHRLGSYLGTWFVAGHPVARWRLRIVRR
jgi:hypothetical protein